MAKHKVVLYLSYDQLDELKMRWVGTFYADQWTDDGKLSASLQIKGEDSEDTRQQLGKALDKIASGG